MKQAPSRVLNEPSNVMGLTGTDILALAILFMAVQRFLYLFGLEVFALLVAFAAGIALSIIRMKFRRGIIRNAVHYYFMKIFLSGLIYVRKTH